MVRGLCAICAVIYLSAILRLMSSCLPHVLWQLGEGSSMDMWRVLSTVRVYTLKLCSGLENGVWPRGSIRSAKTCLI